MLLLCVTAHVSTYMYIHWLWMWLVCEAGAQYSLVMTYCGPSGPWPWLCYVIITVTTSAVTGVEVTLCVSDDQVYIDDPDWRNEYVLNDSGKIYTGNYKQVPGNSLDIDVNPAKNNCIFGYGRIWWCCKIFCKLFHQFAITNKLKKSC